MPGDVWKDVKRALGDVWQLEAGKLAGARDHEFSTRAELLSHLPYFVLRSGQRLDCRPLAYRIGVAAVLALQPGGGADNLARPRGVPDPPSRHRIGLRQRVEHDALGLEPRIDQEAILFRAHDELGRRAAQTDHRGEAHPCRPRYDDFVTLVEERADYVGLGLLASG